MRRARHRRTSGSKALVALAVGIAASGATACAPDPRAASPALLPVWTEAEAGVKLGAAAVAAGVAFAADDAGTLRALDCRTGARRWRADLAGAAAGAPVADAEHVFVVTRSGEVQAISQANGALLWSTSLGAAVTAGLALAAGRVFAVSAEGVAVALDAAGGAVLWRSELGAPVAVTPGASEAALLIASFDGQVTCLDPASGALRWRAAPDPTYVIGTPLLTGARGVVVPGYEDTLWGLSAADGSTRWSREAGNYLVALPVLRSGAVYFGAAHGPVNSVDEVDGAVRWSAPEVLHGRQAILVPAGAHLLVVDRGGPLTWLDGADGTLLGIDDLGYEVEAAVLDDGAAMLVVSADSALHGLALASEP